MISMGHRRNWPILGRFRSTGMLCGVSWLIATDNAEEHAAFIFSVILGLLNSEGEGTTLI